MINPTYHSAQALPISIFIFFFFGDALLLHFMSVTTENCYSAVAVNLIPTWVNFHSSCSKSGSNQTYLMKDIKWLPHNGSTCVLDHLCVCDFK